MEIWKPSSNHAGKSLPENVTNTEWTWELERARFHPVTVSPLVKAWSWSSWALQFETINSLFLKPVSFSFLLLTREKVPTSTHTVSLGSLLSAYSAHELCFASSHLPAASGHWYGNKLVNDSWNFKICCLIPIPELLAQMSIYNGKRRTRMVRKSKGEILELLQFTKQESVTAKVLSLFNKWGNDISSVAGNESLTSGAWVSWCRAQKMPGPSYGPPQLCHP